MLAYASERITFGLLSVLAASLVVFLLLHVARGDPTQIAAGQFATPELIESMRKKWGLDRTVPEQFVRFLSQLAKGDLGTSFRTGRLVATEIANAYPVTLQLSLIGMGIAIAIGIPSGVLSASRRGTAIDYILTSTYLTGMSIPTFWLGIILLLVFSLWIPLFPTSGWDGPQHLVLPGITIGLAVTAQVARQTRSAMLEVLSMDYIRTGRAKGLKGKAVLYKHALKNALIPVVTVIALQFGQLLAGAVLTETVFGLPGLGNVLIVSITSRDLPMVRGAIMFMVASFVIINVLTDLLYSVLDPRVGSGRS